MSKLYVEKTNWLKIRIAGLAIVAFLFNGTSAYANTSETVYFLSDDLKSAVSYFSSRYSGVGNYSFLFDKGYDKRLIMYARPKDYRWNDVTYNNKPMEQLLFPQTSSYAYLQRHLETSEFLETADNMHYHLYVDGGQCMKDDCLEDENIIAVVLPQKFKVTKYEATVKGEWKVIGNTFTFYSQSVKGASANIYFEDTIPYAYAEIAKALAKFNDINIAYDGSNVKVAMPSEGMFESGKAAIEKKGEAWLIALADTLKDMNIKELRVEGHTDNIPIKTTRTQVYPTNWELSAGRAANIVKYLVSIGIDAKKLAAVGYADSRPITNNDTPANRAKNRRIEFTIVPIGGDAVASKQ